jgi:hypothetical protein
MRVFPNRGPFPVRQLFVYGVLFLQQEKILERLAWCIWEGG